MNGLGLVISCKEALAGCAVSLVKVSGFVQTLMIADPVILDFSHSLDPGFHYEHMPEYVYHIPAINKRCFYSKYSYFACEHIPILQYCCINLIVSNSEEMLFVLH